MKICTYYRSLHSEELLADLPARRSNDSTLLRTAQDITWANSWRKSTDGQVDVIARI